MFVMAVAMADDMRPCTFTWHARQVTSPAQYSRVMLKIPWHQDFRTIPESILRGREKELFR
jgi:hypothetical protein